MNAKPPGAFIMVRNVEGAGLPGHRRRPYHAGMSPAAFRACAALPVSAGLVALLWASAYGTLHGSVFAGIARLAADPWGLATLLDLGLGLIFAGAWMHAVTADRRRLWLWWPLLALLGNIATAIFLLARLRGSGSMPSWLTERR